jgi:hypothetical protein
MRPNCFECYDHKGYVIKYFMEKLLACLAVESSINVTAKALTRVREASKVGQFSSGIELLCDLIDARLKAPVLS